MWVSMVITGWVVTACLIRGRWSVGALVCRRLDGILAVAGGGLGLALVFFLFFFFSEVRSVSPRVSATEAFFFFLGFFLVFLGVLGCDVVEAGIWASKLGVPDWVRICGVWTSGLMGFRTWPFQVCGICMGSWRRLDVYTCSQMIPHLRKFKYLRQTRII
jgi:hypothetical protein